jgi:hypothetical protein
MNKLPPAFRKIVVEKLSTNFREATKVHSVKLDTAIPSTSVIVKNAFAGINASDINFTAGLYLPGVQRVSD